MTRHSTARPAAILTTSAPRKPWQHWLVVAAVLLIFAPVARHGFVDWDDNRTIEGNSRIANPSIGNVVYYWGHSHLGLYIPVTYTVWSVLALFAQVRGPGEEAGTLDPRVFHAASVAIHLANALLVYSLLRRLLRKKDDATLAPGNDASAWAAAAGALLFALHPVQVEAVAWASGLKDLLCAAFLLAGMGQYLRSVDLLEAESGSNDSKASETPSRAYRHYGFGMLALLLAMLSKPTAMVGPLLVLILDVLILQRPLRRAARFAAPWFALAIPCLIWTKLCQPGTHLLHTAIWTRPLVAADALAFYLYKLVFPVSLGLDYGRSPDRIFADGVANFTWVLPAAVAVALFTWRKRPGAATLTAAALLVVAGVSPVLGFTPFSFQTESTVADHYLYPAMLGPALAAAWLVRKWADRSVAQSGTHTAPAARLPASLGWQGVASALVLALWAIGSFQQIGYWRDSRTLLAHAAQVNPRSWPVCTNLAFIMFAEGQALSMEAGLLETKQIAPDPRFRDAAECMAASNRHLQQADALYTHALRLYPDNIAARHARGAIRLYFKQNLAAAEDFSQAIRLRERLAAEDQPLFNQDTDLLGEALLAAGRPGEAAECFRAALRLTPAPAEAADHLVKAEAAVAALAKASATPAVPATQPATGPAETDAHHEASELVPPIR